jgi:hypothetical protein
MYITLLLISSQIKDDNEEFNALLGVAIEKMKKPWENTGLSIEDLQASLKEKYDTVRNESTVANQISDILAKYTQGNPRKIKRFLNMLLLRKQMADARGFGDAVHIPILAKLMLAEYYFLSQYKEIATLTDDSGKCPILLEYEKLLAKSDQSEEMETAEPLNAEAVTKGKSVPEKSKQDEHIESWQKEKAFSEWVESEPALGDIDLRPYFFASKEREDFFFEQIKSEQLRELVSRLMGGTMVVATASEEITKLTQDDAKTVFEHLTNRIKKSGDISKQPKGIDGIRVLVERHKELEPSLVGLIENFNAKTVGAWVCNGWDKSITTDAYKTRLRTYLSKLVKEGSLLTKKAAQTALN